MAREEAIKIIKECKEKGFKYTLYTLNEYHTALDMAIEALEREDAFLNKVLGIIEDRIRYWTSDNKWSIPCEWVKESYEYDREKILGLKEGGQE